MTPEQALFWQNALTFAGVASLSVPALSLNRRKKNLARLKAILTRRRDQDTAADRAARRKSEEEANALSDWRLIDEACLYLGYALIFGASVWRLL
ncbi:MAG: hypothetical protein NXH84_04690 [Rhodobacteraceae bacterium]|jgi:hypothetical protein|nr:hypothetical protein [Paracoccaceae bacterium]